MANYDQLNTIGSGAYFPIHLSQSIGKDGKPEYISVNTKYPSTKWNINEILLDEYGGIAKTFTQKTYIKGMVVNATSMYTMITDSGLPSPSIRTNNIGTLEYRNIAIPVKVPGTVEWELRPNINSETRKVSYGGKNNLQQKVIPGGINTTISLHISKPQEECPDGYVYIYSILDESFTSSQGINIFNIKWIPDSNEVILPKTGWYRLEGDVRLIKQNLTSILTYQIGQRFRQEDFGSRTWECLEEPNTSALNLMIKSFVEEGISSWEPRIAALKVLTIKPTKESIKLMIYFRVQDSQKVEELNFQYNLNNYTTDAY